VHPQIHKKSLGVVAWDANDVLEKTEGHLLRLAQPTVQGEGPLVEESLRCMSADLNAGKAIT